MVEVPSWNASLHIQTVDDDAVVLVDETDYAILRGRVYPELVALIDGRRSVLDLIADLDDKVSAPEVMLALHELETRGFVLESGNGMDVASTAFWHMLRVDTATVASRFAKGRIDIDALGTTPGARMEAALERVLATRPSASGPESSSDDDAIGIVLVDDYLDPRLAERNTRALADGHRWLLVKPVGTVLWIGPLFVPGETGCWECLAQRLRNNRQVESFLERRLDGGGPIVTSKGRLSSYVEATLELVAAEVAKAIAQNEPSPLVGAVVTFDTRTLATRRHVLTLRPQCPACGDPSLAATSAARPVVLRSAKKLHQYDGGHRVKHPEATFRDLEPHLSPITGVITALDELSDVDNAGLAYSYAAGHNFALVHDRLDFLLQNLRGRSGGKGATRIQAQVSAMCEAIERYSGVYRGNVIEHRSTYADLDAPKYHPNDLMLFSEDQYARRHETNRGTAAYHRVPEPFDEDREVSWTPVWSITGERFVHIPTNYCYFGHPDMSEWFFCTSDGNGNAAGNTIEEAILQAFMELVERDSVALWWYNRLRRPEFDLDSLDDAYVDDLRDWYQRSHRSLRLIDITSDLRIPVFAAVSHRLDHPVQDIVVAFGAHFDPRVAAKRALTEVNQFLPAVSERDERGNARYWFPDEAAIVWWKTSTLETEPYLVPARELGVRTLGDFADAASNDLREDVERCASVVAALGSEMLVLDQTQLDIGLNVVKVIVPGLRHFWKRFGRGRLYDTPIELGWSERPTPEHDLNPTGIFF